MVSVDSRGKVAVTDKGLVFVEEYARMSDFLRHMGLLP
jgi:predicted transcriptional regulator